MRNLAHSLVPVLTGEDQLQLQEYTFFYEKYQPEMAAEGEKLLSDHPFWGPFMKNTPKEIREQRSKISRELQRDAVFNNNWEPYILNMIEQGIMYARMGIDFQGWYE